MTESRTLAQLYCLAGGAALLLAGIVGFFVDAHFGTGSNPRGDDLIVFKVNGWHNIVHILSGAAALAVWRRADAARTFALAFGIIYGAVTIYGLIAGSNVLGLIAINGADNILHLVLALAGIAAALASPAPGAGRARTTAT